MASRWAAKLVWSMRWRRPPQGWQTYGNGFHFALHELSAVADKSCLILQSSGLRSWRGCSRSAQRPEHESDFFLSANCGKPPCIVSCMIVEELLTDSPSSREWPKWFSGTWQRRTRPQCHAAYAHREGSSCQASCMCNPNWSTVRLLCCEGEVMLPPAR